MLFFLPFLHFFIFCNATGTETLNSKRPTSKQLWFNKKRQLHTIIVVVLYCIDELSSKQLATDSRRALGLNTIKYANNESIIEHEPNMSDMCPA